ncbi:MAG: fructose-1,6-bisphosphatase [Candidatus Diapherotrites archaeon]|nr:fructose-1,6-bisphosphatase [Candidatus Diapherotrites archaeon]
MTTTLAQNLGEGELKELILAIAGVTKEISAGFFDKDGGSAGTENVYGDEQQKMDVWADGKVIEALKASGLVACIGSEEQPEEVKTGQGKYAVAVDPLDGSGNLGAGLLVGSIFGVYEGDTVVKPGKELKAALYALYGPVTTLVVTTGNGVDEYVLEGGEYLLRETGLKMPEGKFVVPGASRDIWTDDYKALIDSLCESGVKIRNQGSMAADFHLALKKGGMYTYPGIKGAPEGKIRLLFEANPLSFIAAQAGGMGTDGKQNILDIVPGKLQQRTPVFVGSKNFVEKVL